MEMYADGIADTGNGAYLISLTESRPRGPNSASRLRIIKTDTSGVILKTEILENEFRFSMGYGELVPTDDGYFLVTRVVLK